MTISLKMLLTPLFAAFVLLSAHEPVHAVSFYSNDFNTRDSTGTIGGTTTFNYATGNLVGSQDNTSGTQDSWIRRNNGTRSVTVEDDGGNQYAAIGPAFDTGYAYAVQKVGSSFSGSPLRVTIDMKSATDFHDSSLRNQLYYLGDDTFYDGATNFFQSTAAAFGFTEPSAGAPIALLARNGDGSGAFTNIQGADVNSSNWYRFIADVDFATNTYSLNVYDLGASHPTLTTPTPGTLFDSFTGLGFRTDNIDISSHGITSFGNSVGEAQFDNVNFSEISNNSAIPEPSSFLMIVWLALGLLRRRRR